MAVTTEQVHHLLNPASIALVGASDESAWSQGFMRNLARFEGDLHLVNPRRATAFGRPTYPSLSELPSKVDHAVVLVRAALVPSVLRDAAAAGIRSATVVASDLGESPGVGMDLAEEVRSIAENYSIAVLGSNCYGFNNYAGTYVSRYNIDVPSEPGAIGFSFQSGQLGGATADAASARGIHLRYVVSAGNELVVDFNDFLEYFLESDDIRVTGGSVERIADPARFERLALRALELEKPVVLLKPGRSDAASRIAVAHTGSITGSDAIADAFLRDLGVIRVDSVEELAETAGMLERRGWPRGRRSVYVGFSGGACELFADQAEPTSISLEPYSSKLLEKLSAISGLSQSVIHNPFDLTVDAMSRYPELVEALAASGEYDVIVSQGAPKRSFEAAAGMDIADARRERNSSALQQAQQYGVVGVFHETSDHQPGIGVFSYTPPNQSYFALGRNGVQAISNTVDYGARRAALATSSGDYELAASERGVLPETIVPGATTLSETDSKLLLRAYGIGASEDLQASTAEDAVAAARAVGYPVVMKVVAPELAHKSDVGGVALNIRDDAGAERAFVEMMETVSTKAPHANIEGVIVSRFTQGGTEFIAGIDNDPHLGPMVVAGLGGVLVEVFKDAVLLRPPFSMDEALHALRSLQSAPLLEGVRGGPPLDSEAFADALCRLGVLALEQRHLLSELDINPLLVFPRGEGVLAVDALAVLKP
jgi:acetyltransferase